MSLLFQRMQWFFIVLCTFCVSAYAADMPAGTSLAKKQELVRGIGAEVPSLDPHKSEAMNSSIVIRDLLEGLTSEDENGNLIPAVASHWQTEDNRTFLFYLRQDAVWSNGDPVTAHDFVYSWRRLADPLTAAPYGWFLEMTTLKNAADVLAGKLKPEQLGITAIDNHTLKIELTESLPYFPKMLVHTSVKPVHQATIEKHGDRWTRRGNFVGNGAFILNEWVVNERMVLIKNNQYMDAKDTILEKVTYLPIENQVAEMNRFFAGEVDITYEVPNEHFKRLAKEHSDSVVITPMLCSYYYGVRVDNPPFDDVRIRQALAYALDRDIITHYITGKGETPAYYFTPDKTADMQADLPEYAKWSQDERNEKARQLLAQAGYDKNNPLEIELLYNTSENHKKIATAIRQLWKQTLGVRVSLVNEEWKTFLDTRRFGTYQLTRSGWCGDYNEPSTFLTLLLSNNSSNDMHYKNAECDAVVNQALKAKDLTSRRQAYADAEAILARDMPIIPIYHYVNARLVKKKVGGYPLNNALDIMPSKYMYIKAE